MIGPAMSNKLILPNPERPRKSRARSLRRNWPYLLFIMPGLALLLIFFYAPAASAIYYAFFDWDGHDKIFTGLENFRELAHDPMMLTGFRNLLIYSLLGLVISITVPLGVAELIFNLRSAHRRNFYQVAFLVTGLVPGIVVILLWKFLLDPYFGPINALLAHAGFDRMHFLWLADPHLALYCLLLIGCPWVAGTSVLIFLAGLNNIPTSVLDYCRLEGLEGFRRFLYIDLHFIFGQLRLLSITSFIGLMQAFGLQLILTKGGPGLATMVPGYHMYLNAFSYDRLGYASAIGLVLAMIILAFTILNLRYLKVKN